MRSSVLANFTMADYVAGLSAASSDGSAAFAVSSHKTTTTHDAAIFALNLKEVTMMKGYIKMRNLIPRNEGFVFVTSKGGKMSQSNIASALSAAHFRPTHTF